MDILGGILAAALKLSPPSIAAVGPQPSLSSSGSGFMLIGEVPATFAELD